MPCSAYCQLLAARTTRKCVLQSHQPVALELLHGKHTHVLRALFSVEEPQISGNLFQLPLQSHTSPLPTRNGSQAFAVGPTCREEEGWRWVEKTVPQYLLFQGLSAKLKPWLRLSPGYYIILEPSAALLCLGEAQQPRLASHCPSVHLEGN